MTDGDHQTAATGLARVIDLPDVEGGQQVVQAVRDKALPVPVRIRLRFRGRTLQALKAFAVVFAFASAAALRWFMEAPQRLDTLPSTPASFAASRHSLFLTSAIVLLSTAISLGGIFTWVLDYARVGLMLAAFAAPLRLALAVVSTAYGRFGLVTRPYFALTGRLPWRVLDFLDDASCRGILFQVGPAYLFRHERLLQSLLNEPPPEAHIAPGHDRGSSNRQTPTAQERKDGTEPSATN
ncbi:hypothetical protein EAO75_01535 [Streptomyces sp. uw30]|uniref:hypothetical protein n=1 Tax=Streptomyces sp. uw30 TaxID=1828179 RepID=UPI0011CE33C8|nr:hypothetical protein [Streptomyces sp. uw30]TXS54255.1 hypothetical protein EAO75_01535 [Streptomyces sp. uw30]